MSIYGMNNLFVPLMDIVSVGGSLIIRLDIPGMTSDDIDIQMSKDGIMIQGERKDELANLNRMYQERRYSEFQRYIQVPKNSILSEAIANCANGVLTITVPLEDNGDY